MADEVPEEAKPFDTFTTFKAQFEYRIEQMAQSMADRAGRPLDDKYRHDAAERFADYLATLVGYTPELKALGERQR